jgi:hypothetical protein
MYISSVRCKWNMEKAKIVFLAIVTAIVYLSLPISYAGLTPELVTYLVFVGFMVIGLGMVAFYIGEGSILMSAGLLVLALASFVFLYLATDFNAFEFWHIVAILEGNPNSNSYVQETTGNAIKYGIFPTVLGIGLFIAPFVKRRKTPSGWIRNLLLLIGGGVFASYGIFYFQSVGEYYSEAIGYVNNFGESYMKDSLQAIYSAQQWTAIPWIVAGILLIITSVPYFAQLVARKLHSNSLPTNAEKAARAYD